MAFYFFHQLFKNQHMTHPTKKNTGRPVQPIKRENSTGIRLTKAEHFIIFQKARRTGMNLTTYIRQMAIHGTVVARLTEEDRQFVRQLIQLSGDMHQLVQLAREQGILKVMLHFETVRQKVDKVLQQLHHDK
jgi:hypothetical protein